MADDLTIRGLRPDDRGVIESILRGVGVFREDEVRIGLELVDETLQPGPSTDYRWHLAERNGIVVGFACHGPVPMTEGAFDLYWIAVDPRDQGLGTAASLERAVVEQSRSAGARWILAETSSTPAYARANAFYLARGYARVGWIPDFYRPGDGRITYGKRLDRE